MINKLLYIVIALFVLPVFAQGQRQVLTGRVVAGSFSIRDVLVVNVNSQTEMRTDNLGFFVLASKAGDTLVITEQGIDEKRVVLSKENLKSNIFIIEITLKDTYQMEELVIEQNNRLTAEALRIVPKGVAKYTPAERKYITGGRIGPRMDTEVQGASVSVDGIINVFNGRRRMLKQGLKTERKEQLMEVVTGIYSDETITKELGIPAEYVDGFLFYVVDDKTFDDAVKRKDTNEVKVRIGQLAILYLETIANEK
jgi:hypothetical protein